MFALMLTDITMAFAEQYGLLPEHHFGGCHGRWTTDTMHLIVHWIKQVWHRKNVVFILFLDIQGAFLNVVKERLSTHNMQKSRVPTLVVNAVIRILTGKTVYLKFDDYVLDPFPLLNSIGQGDLILMIIYLFYNVDLLQVAKGLNKMAGTFVDDTAFLAKGPSFVDMHTILKRLMNREGGAFEWLRTHNSHFETSRFTLINVTKRKDVPRPPIQIGNNVIQLVPTHKFLGVIFDQELYWKPQIEYTIA
jgi:hypothetical protein